MKQGSDSCSVICRESRCVWLLIFIVRYVCSVKYLCMNEYTMIAYRFILHNKTLSYPTPNCIIIFLNLATNAMEWAWWRTWSSVKSLVCRQVPRSAHVTHVLDPFHTLTRTPQAISHILSTYVVRIVHCRFYNKQVQYWVRTKYPSYVYQLNRVHSAARTRMNFYN